MHNGMFIPAAPDLEYLNLILARAFSYVRRIAGAPRNPRRRNSDRETAKNTDTPQCPPGSTLAPPTTSRKTTPSASTMPGAPSPATAPKTTRFTRATGCARTSMCILAEGLLMGMIIECPSTTAVSTCATAPPRRAGLRQPCHLSGQGRGRAGVAANLTPIRRHRLQNAVLCRSAAISVPSSR